MIGEFGEELDSITLIRGADGRFEVTVDGSPIFSKAELKRHAQPGEIVQKIQQRAAGGRDLREMTH